MEPSSSSARYFLRGYVEKPKDEQGEQQSFGAEPEEPSKFESPEDYLNEGPNIADVEEVKDHLIEKAQAAKRVSAPYA
jgi:hypothetical protein